MDNACPFRYQIEQDRALIAIHRRGLQTFRLNGFTVLPGPRYEIGETIAQNRLFALTLVQRVQQSNRFITLASQLGSIEYARPRRFREKLDSWLDSIRVLWPECPTKISADGASLIVDRGYAVLADERIRP